MHRNQRRHLLALLVLSFALPACGIVFSAEFEGTEVFRDLDIPEEAAAGSPVEAIVTVRQPYPLPLAIACRYENTDLTDDERRVAFAERAVPVFDAVLEPAEEEWLGEDAEDPPEQEHRFEFTVEEPGEYFLACFTFAAPENGIGQRFDIRAP